MSELPIWLSWVQALAIPAIALLGVLIAGSNLWLAIRKRKNELFDRRFRLFQDISDVQRGISSDGYDPENAALQQQRSDVLARTRLLFNRQFAGWISDRISKGPDIEFGEYDGEVLEKFADRMK